MKTSTLNIASAAAVTLGANALAADTSDVNELVAKIKSQDDSVRGPAWQGAGPVGARALGPLAEVMTDPDFETARCAKRAIEKIVRHAGCPGADAERKAVQGGLVGLLTHGSPNVRRHAAWMLSEIGDDASVGPIAALLADREVREDARCAIERIPGATATAALRKAMSSVPEDFKYAVAHSLRVRGEKVEGYPSQKLVPTKQTSVEAA